MFRGNPRKVYFGVVNPKRRERNPSQTERNFLFYNFISIAKGYSYFEMVFNKASYSLKRCSLIGRVYGSESKCNNKQGDIPL